MISERLLPDLISAGVAEAFKNKGFTPTPPRTATIVSVDNRNATAVVTMDGEPFQSTMVRTLVPVAVADRVVVDFTTGGGAWVRGVLGAAAWQSFGAAAISSGLNVSNGTVAARYVQRGREVIVQMTVALGSTSSVSGQIVIALPVQAAPVAEQILLLKCFDVSAGLNFSGFAIIPAGGTSAPLYTNVAVTATSPFTWATGDNFAVAGTYEGA